MEQWHLGGALLHIFPNIGMAAAIPGHTAGYITVKSIR